ncbi:MAG TPA: hypothetical protein VGZ02_12145 [Candidatus Baltobacteraceae bacterium]|jgi:hypothetical protein|nr:hypothetical protein [Candidatus Baltobacteraceae bacterium]
MRIPKAAFSLGAVLAAAAVLTACGSSGSAMQSGSSAFAQGSGALPRIVTLSDNEKMEYIPARDSSVPPAGVPAIVNGWISLSLAIGGTPCVNCVGSPPITGSLGVAFPEPYLPLKSTFELTYTFYNVREASNACTLTFNFKQGTTVLFTHAYAVTLNGNGQYVYFVATPLPSTAKAGQGSVSANMKCGTFTSKNATQTVYLH